MSKEKMLKRNFVRMALAVEDLSKKYVSEKNILASLNDTVKLTKSVLDNALILGKDAPKVNILKSYYDILDQVIQKGLELEETNDKKENKKG